MEFFKISHLFELIALVVSLFLYKRLKGSFLQWMPLFLFFIFYGEMGGAYFFNVLKKPNSHIYLWIYIFSTIYYNYCFYHLLKKRKTLQKIIIITAAIWVLIDLFFFFFIYDYSEYKNYVTILSGISLSVFACFYLYYQFMEDDLEILLIQQPGFWIAAGVLIFYSGICTIYALHPLIVKYNLEIFGMKLHHFVPIVLSVFLYSSLSIAMFLWKGKT